MMRSLICVVVITVLFSVSMMAQGSIGGINAYGYFQSTFYVSKPSISKANNSFDLQQLNLFFSRNLGSGFSAFVNFELANSFSSSRSWGSFNLEEAWLKYSYSQELNVKIGQLVPTFNNLNEIKNRTPLLPYVMRPLIYESTYYTMINVAPFLPERAFVQVYGSKNISDLKLDYAVFGGNSDVTYANSKTGDNWTDGNDTTSFKMVGGRIGLRGYGAKLGVSSTWDRYRAAIVKDNYGVIKSTMFLGNVPRLRLGIDFSYTGYGFFFESEVILVNHDVSQASQDSLNRISQPVKVPVGVTPAGPIFATFASPYGNSFDKSFYYGTLGYEFTDKLYAYVGMSKMHDDFNKVFDATKIYTIGGGFKPVESVVFKLQYYNMDLGEVPMMGKYTHNLYYCAVSVMF